MSHGSTRIVVLIVLALVTTAPGQPCAAQVAWRQIPFVSRLGEATTGAVYAAGQFVYLGQGQRLVVLDVSDPRAPRVVSETQTFGGNVRGLCISEGYAYVVSYRFGSSALWIVDVSEPPRPTVAATWRHPAFEYLEYVYVRGDYAYVTGYGPDRGIAILDVSDPAHPSLAGTLLVGTLSDSQGTARGLYVEGNYAYLAHGHGGLVIADVSQPHAPKLLGSWRAVEGEIVSVTVRGSRAYLAHASASGGGLAIADVTDPRQPVLLGQCATAHNAQAVYVPGDRAYLMAGPEMHVIDVADPAVPAVVGTVETGALAIGAHGSSGHLYVSLSGYSGPGGLRIVDVRDPATPAIVGAWGSSLGPASSVYAREEYAYVGVGQEGLRIVDVRDPYSPAIIGELPPPDTFRGDYVDVSGRYAYLLGGSGMWIADVGDPAHPVVQGVIPLPEGARRLYVHGDLVFVAAGDNGLVVVDSRDRSRPMIVGAWQSPGVLTAEAVCTGGQYAYVAGGGRLWVFDVREPSRPTVLGAARAPHSVGSMQIVGEHLYVAGGGGLWTIYIGEPVRPLVVSEGAMMSSVNSAYVAGSYAYVTMWYFGARIVDISCPWRPYEVADYSDVQDTQDIHVSEGYVYIADGRGGLLILSAALPQAYLPIVSR